MQKSEGLVSTVVDFGMTAFDVPFRRVADDGMFSESQQSEAVREAGAQFLWCRGEVEARSEQANQADR